MLKKMIQYLIERKIYDLVFTSAKHIQSEQQIAIQQQQQQLVIQQQEQQQKMVQNKLKMMMKNMMMEMMKVHFLIGI